jgi:hypothetical protein
MYAKCEKDTANVNPGWINQGLLIIEGIPPIVIYNTYMVPSQLNNHLGIWGLFIQGWHEITEGPRRSPVGAAGSPIAAEGLIQGGPPLDGTLRQTLIGEVAWRWSLKDPRIYV